MDDQTRHLASQALEALSRRPSVRGIIPIESILNSSKPQRPHSLPDIKPAGVSDTAEIKALERDFNASRDGPRHIPGRANNSTVEKPEAHDRSSSFAAASPPRTHLQESNIPAATKPFTDDEPHGVKHALEQSVETSSPSLPALPDTSPRKSSNTASPQQTEMQDRTEQIDTQPRPNAVQSLEPVEILTTSSRESSLANLEKFPVTSSSIKRKAPARITDDFQAEAETALGKIHPCRFCPRSFEQPCLLTRHEKTHTRPWKCDIDGCNSPGFVSKNDLDRHKRGCHSQELVSGTFYVCTHGQCDDSKKWPRKDNFRSHLSRVHKIECELDQVQKYEVHIGSKPPQDDMQKTSDDLQEEDTIDPMQEDEALPDDASSPASTGSIDDDEEDDDDDDDDNDDVMSSITVAYSNHDISDSEEADVVPSDAEETQPPPSEGLAIMFPFTVTSHDSVKSLLKELPTNVLEDELARRVQDEQGNTFKSRGHKCHICNKEFRRKCELRKHMARHNKPWACTFRECDARMGSKDDWKRHESRMHFHNDTWTCNEMTSGNDACKAVVYSREAFRQHLVGKHGMKKSLLDRKMLECGKTRGYSSPFWCGFCREHVHVSSQHDAWTERCDHIDKHFRGVDTPKMEIEQWEHQAEETRVEDSENSDGEHSADGSDLMNVDDTPPSPEVAVIDQRPARDARKVRMSRDSATAADPAAAQEDSQPRKHRPTMVNRLGSHKRKRSS
ncbi:hypothetical protein F66182_5248 [Fusarium sp. NRRL 66182]|nr:hypothetical protein F66182_5248 [Fusarium sp. NRRL 66182]